MNTKIFTTTSALLLTLLAGFSGHAIAEETVAVAASTKASAATPAPAPVLKKVLFDEMRRQNGKMSAGEGLWFGDDDHSSGGTSKNLDRHGRSVSQGLPRDKCPIDSDRGPSPCYVGWNVENGDAYTELDGKTVLSSSLELSSYVNPQGWEWTSAGWVAQFKGKTTEVIPYGFSSEDVLEITLNYPEDETLILKAFEKGYADIGTNQRPNTAISGTGKMRVYKIPMSQFKVDTWAANKYDPAQVYRVAIFRQAAATAAGEAMNASDKGAMKIAIQCLGLNGGCSSK